MMLMARDIPYWPDDDSRDAYDRFLSETFVKYKGCLITKTNEGYKWNNKDFSTLELAQGAIDQTVTVIGDGLKRISITLYDRTGKETLLPDEFKSGYLTGKSPYDMYINNRNQ